MALRPLTEDEAFLFYLVCYAGTGGLPIRHTSDGFVPACDGIAYPTHRLAIEAFERWSDRAAERWAATKKANPSAILKESPRAWLDDIYRRTPPARASGPLPVQLSLFDDGKGQRSKTAKLVARPIEPSARQTREKARSVGGSWPKTTATSEKTLKDPSGGSRRSSSASGSDTVRETFRGSELAETPAQWLGEARGDSVFKSFWRGADAGTRAYVFACFTLAKLAARSTSRRTQLFRDIALEPRVQVLSRLGGVPVVSGALGILASCEAAAFRRSDWIALLREIEEPATRRAMSQLDRVTPVLVRQLASVPSSMRQPALLRVLNELTVDSKHWEELTVFLDKSGKRRATLIRGARKVQGIGDFWDLFHRCRDAALMETMSLREAVDLGPQFTALTSANAMRKEGLRMRNCLGRLVDKAARGQSSYFAWLGPARATVELSPVDGQWRLGPIRGEGNEAVSPPTVAKILAAVAGVLGPRLKRTPTTEVQPPGFGRSIAIGRREFSLHERADLAKALWSIHDRSISPTNGAFVIVDADPGYFQCLASTGSDYILEISSHHLSPKVAGYLTSDAVRLLDDSGFDWPGRQSNFSRVLRVSSPAVAADLADFVLAVLWGIFDLRSTGKLRVRVHIPTAPEVSGL